MSIISFYKRFHEKDLPLILTDLKGYVEYRNDVYNLNYEYPKTSYAQKKLAFLFFRRNINGFRDMVYYRLGNNLCSRFLKKIWSPTPNCHMDIGQVEPGGIVFHHAFSIFINADYVGRGTNFRNNTTVGNKLVKGTNIRPYIEDHVTVGVNSVLIGGIRIGHHAVIGAGSVVVKDVPAYAVVAGNPARILYIKDKENVDE